MKNYVGNGYYYIGFLGHFYINNNSKNQYNKICLNNGESISDKEHLKKLFAESLKKDLNELNVKRFFCITHDSFIDLIEHMGYEIKIKIPVTKKANINELFKYWKCDKCKCCANKNHCFVCNGKVPNIDRNEYFLVFNKT